jgi:drug/metabolite transporter (DMT)-like permease
MTVQIGISLALLCAFFSNLAFLYKHRGAVAAPGVAMRHPLRSAVGLLRSPWFAIGMAVAVVAWLFHVAALALAPLSLVQAVLAGGLVWLAVLADRMSGFTVAPRQWAGVALTATGLALLALTVPHGGPSSSYSIPAMIAFEGGLAALGAMLVLSPRVGAPEHHRGLALGAAAGIMFGVSDIAIKALTGLDGPVAILASPWLLTALAASVAAFYASARGLQRGEAVPVITITAAAANVSIISGGIVVFGDPVAGDAVGILVEIAAFALVIVAAVLTPAPVRAARSTA